MKILNATQHQATREQLDAGVVDLPDETRSKLAELLTFDELPGMREVNDRACDVARMIAPIYRAIGATAVMIGDAPPFLLSALESALIKRRMRPVYYVVLSVEVGDEVVKYEGFVEGQD